MPRLTFDPQTDGATPEMEAAAAAALEQGEKLYQMQEEDRNRRLQQTEDESETPQLIAGKFKSQEDLLKAYKELEARLGKKDEGEGEEASEEPTEASEETPKEDTEASPVADAILKASSEYEKGGLSEETIKQLAQVPSEELIKTFIELSSKQAQQTQQQSLADAEQKAIMDVAGGEKGYGDMIAWAAENLDPSEIDAYNSVTNSGNAAAIRFAAEALYNRYKSAEGYEAPMVTGKGKAPSVKAYRSQAELLRDLQNPLYDQDPAFRADVEKRLEASGDLL